MTDPSLQREFQNMVVVHLAIVTGVVLFVMISFMIVNKPYLDFTRPFILLFTGTMAVAGSLAARSVLKTKAAQIEGAPAERLKRYRQLHIVILAMLEAAALLNVVLWLVTHNLVFLFIAAVPVAVMLWDFPKKDRFFD